MELPHQMLLIADFLRKLFFEHYLIVVVMMVVEPSALIMVLFAVTSPPPLIKPISSFEKTSKANAFITK